MEEISWGLYLWLLRLVNISEWQALTEFFDTQDQTFMNVLSIVGVVVLIIGLLQCFLGYKLFKIWCGIVGFFIGVLLAIALATSGILHDSPAADIISLLLIIIIGITGALIANKVYLVGLFLYAFFAFFVVGFIASAVFTSSFLACLVAGIIAGTAMGVLVVMYRKFWVILMSSVHGAMSICFSLMMIMQSADLGPAFILAPVLGIAGFFVQFFVDKKKIEKTEKPAAVAAGAPHITAETKPVSEATGTGGEGTHAEAVETVAEHPTHTDPQHPPHQEASPAESPSEAHPQAPDTHQPAPAADAPPNAD